MRNPLKSFFVLIFVNIMNTNGNLMMKRLLIVSLVISVFCLCSLESSDFHLNNLEMDYQTAKIYCRKTFTDLATVQSSSDVKRLNDTNTAGKDAWIGLELGTDSMWHWSLSNGITNYSQWRSGQPQKTGKEACVAMDQNGLWFESGCANKKSFVCLGNDQKYSLVLETKSWRDAQSHCRSSALDLASVNSEEDNKEIHNLSTSQEVWIGLFRDPWMWSDGSSSSSRFWEPNQPNYNGNLKCVLATSQGMWKNAQCNANRISICYAAQKLTLPATSLQTTKESTTDIQLTTPSQNSSQQVTIGFDFPLPASEQSSTVDINVPKATTTEPKTSNSTGFDNLKPETSTMTTEHLQTTPSSNSANSEHFTLKNLILIQENMTWLEAMSHCREHHIDLVHIATKDIQDLVAEKVKNATSSYVWLGLRYSCTFKFWFWIESFTSCYQNWGPQHGPDSVYECDVSGAIESTGGQQWFGFPDTMELNFLCLSCVGYE